MLESTDVVERMVANTMTAFNHHAIDLRMLTHIVAHHEESGLHAETVERVQHERRGFGNGAIVERKINHFLLSAHPPDGRGIEPAQEPCRLFDEHVARTICKDLLHVGGKTWHICWPLHSMPPPFSHRKERRFAQCCRV